MRTTLLRLLIKTSPRRLANGFQFVDLSTSDLLDDFAAKTTQALGLIALHDRRRFSRIKRDLTRFVLINAGGEFYNHRLRSYVMDVGSMQARSLSEMACAIVHESTHARLCGVGFRQHAVTQQERIERICTTEEARFAERLPGGEELARAVRAKLDNPWWTPEHMRFRRLQQIRASGIPKWLIAIYERFLSRGNRRPNTGD